MAPVERVTLFKIPREEDIERLLEQYRILSQTAVKVICLPRYLTTVCIPLILTTEYRMASPTSPV